MHEHHLKEATKNLMPPTQVFLYLSVTVLSLPVYHRVALYGTNIYRITTTVPWVHRHSCHFRGSIQRINCIDTYVFVHTFLYFLSILIFSSLSFPTLTLSLSNLITGFRGAEVRSVYFYIHSEGVDAGIRLVQVDIILRLPRQWMGQSLVIGQCLQPMRTQLPSPCLHLISHLEVTLSDWRPSWAEEKNKSE